MEKKEIASESGHWYDRQGNPQYTYVNKDGKECKTTLTRAKKMDYVASVTTILGLLDKPQLTNWKIDQAIDSSLTLPKLENESLDDYKKRIKVDAKEQSVKAMAFGNEIHKGIELFLEGKTIDEKLIPYIMPVIQEMERRGWLENRRVEHSFASEEGYGGKTDYNNDIVIIDYKSKDFTEIKDKMAWPEQCYQLAAYRHGLKMTHLEAWNVFISSRTPGLYYFHKWEEEELEKGLSVFLKTLELWKAIKL